MMKVSPGALGLVDSHLVNTGCIFPVRKSEHRHLFLCVQVGVTNPHGLETIYDAIIILFPWAIPPILTLSLQVEHRGPQQSDTSDFGLFPSHLPSLVFYFLWFEYDI